ncbi:hypothetical protein [Pararhodobacter sp. CCB-MM2]|uniref:hypothetical protein n=1 Tax=Pararhodobacter sp. CCB-MM2 TaxID=1786003 RepID=UPI001314F107|nr:hypothetical protein [Pararhodobacter sp. CCB-MM2]MCA2011107.1 hypothetical protein [Cereibacter sphaeroides]
MNGKSIAMKGARNPFALESVENTRGIPGPLGRRPRRPEGTQGLAAWFAGRMVSRLH